MNNNKQLTPEEIKLLCHLYNIYANEYYEGALSDEDRDKKYMELINLHTVQQTAAKDEEIAKHQGSLKEMGLLVLQLQQENKAQDERIKELEETIRIAKDVEAEYLTLVKKNKEKDAHIAELEKECEATANACERWSNKWAKKNDQNQQLLEKVEQLKEAREKDEQGYNEIILRLQAERDQAFDLLENLPDRNDLLDYSGWRAKVKTLLYSRENKKP